MGWLTNITMPYGSTMKLECDKRLTWQDAAGKRRVLRSALVGMREYYAAVEHIAPDGSRTVWAAMFLVSLSRGRYEVTWGYKDMSENCGPCYYNCPGSVLDLLTPTSNEAAVNWRDACRRTIARRDRLKALKPGMRILLDTPMTFTNGDVIDSLDIVKGWRGRGIGFESNGQRYAPGREALLRAGFRVVSRV